MSTLLTSINIRNFPNLGVTWKGEKEEHGRVSKHRLGHGQYCQKESSKEKFLPLRTNVVYGTVLYGSLRKYKLLVELLGV